MAKGKRKPARRKRPTRGGGRRGLARGKQPSRLWRAFLFCLRWGFAAGVAGVVAIAGYLFFLDRQITSTFEGRRWSLPARIYAAPVELYPGAPLSQRDAVAELARLGYRQVEFANAPGSWSVHGNTLRAVLRPFRFAAGERGELPLAIEFDQGRIVRIDDGAGGELPLARLEPPQVGSFFPSHGEDRLILSPEQTPPLLPATLKAVEDRTFDSHPGFDLKGILRAAWVNLSTGELSQGASTLTQQLVRSYYLTNERSFARKLKELAFAVLLEARFTKADLMNSYVNEIHLGQDGTRAVHGFGLGSQFYFNKPIAELGAHEIALLVAVIRGPSYYDPFRHPERARERRDRILGTMHAFGLIGEREYHAALARDMGLAGTRRAGRYYPAFLRMVRQELADDYDADTLGGEGLAIYTTLAPRVQDAAQAAVTATLAQIERERGMDEGILEAGMVVRGSQTGDVQAIVAGRVAGRYGMNRAVSARRQVGSAIKPLVYLIALESGQYDLASLIEDRPVTLDVPGAGNWSPRNFDREYRGPVPLVRALADSLNVPTVRLGMSLGIERVAHRAEVLTGVATQAFPSLLLGAVQLSPMQLSEMYAVFASGGFTTPAKTVLAVVDASGEPLSRYPIRVESTVELEHAATLTRALQVAMTHGTGKRSPHADRGVAGKTGTSNDYRDSWFAAYGARHLSVVWVGRDDGRSHQLTGSAGALRVWNAFAANVDLEPALAAPDNATIEYETGLLAEYGCGNVVSIPIADPARLRAKPGCH